MQAKKGSALVSGLELVRDMFKVRDRVIFKFSLEIRV